MPPRIFIVSYSFPPDNVPAAHRPLHVARALEKSGYTIDLFTRRGRFRAVSSALAAQNSTPSSGAEQAGKQRPARWFKAVRERMLPILDLDKAAPWALKQFIPLTLAVLKATLRSRRRQTIWTTSPGISNLNLACVVAMLTGARLHIDIRDVYAGLLAGPRPWLTYWALRRAQTLTAVTPSLVTAMAQEQQRDVHLVFNGIPDGEVLAIDSPITHDGWLTCLYAGALYGGVRPIEAALASLADAARELNPAWQGLRVRLIARDVFAGAYDHYCHDRFQVQYLSEVAKSEALRESRAAHCNLVLLGNTREHSWAIPLKVYDLLGAGRPMLFFSPSDSDAVKFIRGIENLNAMVHDPWQNASSSPNLAHWLDRAAQAPSRTITEPSADSESRKIVRLICGDGAS